MPAFCNSKKVFFFLLIFSFLTSIPKQESSLSKEQSIIEEPKLINTKNKKNKEFKVKEIEQESKKELQNKPLNKEPQKINKEKKNKDNRISIESKNKKTKGYFGTQTAFFDKDGNPKLLNKDFKSLIFEELEHNRKIHLTKNNDKETIIRYTERMIALGKDAVRIGKLRLEVADLYFEINRFDKSFAFYNEFVKLYPGNKDVERASYRAIISKYQDTLPADKDQSLTIETLKLAKEFNSNENYKNYKNEISKIIKNCKRKLLDYELNIFNFYLNKGNINAAQKRFENIKKDHLDLENTKENKFITKELEKQIQAAKDKKSYKPKYEITSNSTVLDFFITRKKDDIEPTDFDKVKKIEKENLKSNQIKSKRKKIDYVTKF